MPTLIACLSTGKGTWAEVAKIMQSQPWDKIFLVTNSFGKENYSFKNNNTYLIEISTQKETPDLVRDIKHQIKDKISDFEIALNFTSGSGKEHMAILEAVLQLGLNFRLISAHNNTVETLGL